MRVKVKKKQQGFIYGSLRTEGQEFSLKPITCVDQFDAQGDPRVITPKEQFSKTWMVDLEPKAEDPKIEPPTVKSPSQLNVDELKAALNEAEVEFPEEALKPELLALYKNL